MCNIVCTLPYAALIYNGCSIIYKNIIDSPEGYLMQTEAALTA